MNDYSEGATEELVALEAYVVDQLVGGMKPDTIIFEVAQRQGWDWPQAKTFVSQIAESQLNVVQSRQRPLLRIMSVLLMAAGSLLLCLTVATLFEYYATLSRERSDLGFFTLLVSVIVMVAARELPQLIWGGALLLSGLVGWWRTVPRPAPSKLDGIEDEGDPFSL